MLCKDSASLNMLGCGAVQKINFVSVGWPSYLTIFLVLGQELDINLDFVDNILLIV